MLNRWTTAALIWQGSPGCLLVSCSVAWCNSSSAESAACSTATPVMVALAGQAAGLHAHLHGQAVLRPGQGLEALHDGQGRPLQGRLVLVHVHLHRLDRACAGRGQLPAWVGLQQPPVPPPTLRRRVPRGVQLAAPPQRQHEADLCCPRLGLLRPAVHVPALWLLPGWGAVGYPGLCIATREVHWAQPRGNACAAPAVCVASAACAQEMRRTLQEAVPGAQVRQVLVKQRHAALQLHQCSGWRAPAEAGSTHADLVVRRAAVGLQHQVHAGRQEAVLLQQGLCRADGCWEACRAWVGPAGLPGPGTLGCSSACTCEGQVRDDLCALKVPGLGPVWQGRHLDPSRRRQAGDGVAAQPVLGLRCRCRCRIHLAQSPQHR